MRKIHTEEEKRKIVASVIAKKAKNSNETKRICKSYGIGYSTFCAWRVEIEKEEKKFESASVKKMLVTLKNENKIFFKTITEMEARIKALEDFETKAGLLTTGEDTKSPELSVLISVSEMKEPSIIKYKPDNWWAESHKADFFEEVVEKSENLANPGVYAWEGHLDFSRGALTWEGELSNMKAVFIRGNRKGE